MPVEEPASVYAPRSLTYGIVGQYQGGVSISLASSYAATVIQAGLEWPQALPDQYLYLSEDYVAERLIDGDLNPVFLAWWTSRTVKGQLPAIGDTAQLVDFSAAAAGGSVQLTVVPEPSTVVLIAVGSAAVALLRCRRDGGTQ